MHARIPRILVTLLLTAGLSSPALAERARTQEDLLASQMEQFSELLDRLPGELAHATERLRIMTDRLMTLLPPDAELNAALTQFRLFLDGLYLKFSGETAPIPGYREVREKVFEGSEPAEPRAQERIDT